MNWEDYRAITENVRRSVQSTKSTVVGDTGLEYGIYPAPNIDEFHYWCWVDDEGNVYVSDIPDAPDEFRQRFQDLLAYHERLEYDWLKELRLPAPRYVEGRSREAELDILIHLQVHFLELVAAQEMGILDEYVQWRIPE